MAPKAPRKASVSGRDFAMSGIPKSSSNTSMPPPPNPVMPKGILEPEVNALGTCLRVSDQYCSKSVMSDPGTECRGQDRADIWLLCGC